MRTLLLLLCTTVLCAQDYDLVLKGGHLIDPKNKISGRRDVAIKDGKIAAVEANITPAKGVKTIDVAKSACASADLPLIVVPTQLTADGIASPVSVIRGADLLPVSPIGVD